MEIVLIVIVAVVALVIFDGSQRAKALAAAKQKYAQSLSDLKKSPTNADIKQSTLALGRHYSNLTRDKKGNTLFDEVALMNDINAACAAASSRTPEPVPRGTESVEGRLQTLASLKEKGLIEPSEYEKRRAEILASI